MRYRRTEHYYVDAWHFVPGDAAPEWVNAAFSTGSLQFTDFSAKEIRATGRTYHSNASRISKGGWIVRDDPDGEIFLMTDSEFRKVYQPASQTSAQPQDFAEGIAAGAAEIG